MIWIIGGTNEAVELAKKIKQNSDYIITVATEEGKQFFNDDNIVVGRMDETAMKSFCIKKNITVVADISHPYAEEVSKNAKKTCQALKIKYYRYIREESCLNIGLQFKNISTLRNFLKTASGTFFFTTGSKNIPDFETVKGNNRFVYRILPALSSIAICKQCGVEIKNIVAMLGPFSTELNKIMFQEFNTNYVVLKDSGESGGTLEKIEACQQLSITPIILQRPDDTGERDIDKLAKALLKP